MCCLLCVGCGDYVVARCVIFVFMFVLVVYVVCRVSVVCCWFIVDGCFFFACRLLCVLFVVVCCLRVG